MFTEYLLCVGHINADLCLPETQSNAGSDHKPAVTVEPGVHGEAVRWAVGKRTLWFLPVPQLSLRTLACHLASSQPDDGRKSAQA